jgi:hypothetical protein
MVLGLPSEVLVLGLPSEVLVLGLHSEVLVLGLHSEMLVLRLLLLLVRKQLVSQELQELQELKYRGQVHHAEQDRAEEEAYELNPLEEGVQELNLPETSLLLAWVLVRWF